MEQAPRYLHIKCQPAPGDVREGVLRTLCNFITARASNGVDASDEGLYCVGLCISKNVSQ